jgi:transcriptional regulator with AAA-type ATPase domain
MALLTEKERGFAEALSCLTYCNPFLRERIEAERAALGDEFSETEGVWSVRPAHDSGRPNIRRILHRVRNLTEKIRDKLRDGATAQPREMELYEDLVLYRLYGQHWQAFNDLIDSAEDERAKPRRVSGYSAFEAEANRFLQLPGLQTHTLSSLPLVFAISFQIRRAFHNLFYPIVGSSMAAARLRAAAWESIFTHDMRRYYRGLYERMGDITTLITGPSGTGKELVARAIALGRFIPFDPKSQAFADDSDGLFHPLNLSALSPTLIESELFGHRRGAFTGAIEDRGGWLENCPARGTVFLDEIGELDGQIQVKLLRVLQSRTFQRLGDTRTRRFAGKIVAATNRDLAQEMHAGRFRQDFYYRLCSDIIVTPSLAEQLRERPEDRRDLILFIAHRLVGEEAEALTREVDGWIEQNLPQGYDWPGNFRELEQCVRNYLIRRAYRPTPRISGDDARSLADQLRAGALTADQLLQQYCTLVYRQTGSYVETAKRLGLDRRTVKAKVESGGRVQ